MTGKTVLFAASLLLCCWPWRVGGQVTIPSEMTFQLDTDRTTDPPVFTLTCTSTGGPVSTVSWRRDGTMLSDDSTYNITSQILINSEADTYNHTLTVTGRLLGVYQCSVPNSWRATRSLAVGAGSPTNLNVVQVGPNSFRVSWTPVVTVVGYRVYWSVGGQYDSGNMSVGAGDTAVTITGRTTYVTYDVTIVALSDHLPSPAAVVMITLGYPSLWLRSASYQNNSLVTLEDIGEWRDALLCRTTCSSPGIKNWFFPNGTKVPSEIVEWDFYHTGYSHWSTIYMQRRRGGENGIYRCEIPDAMNITQTIYIGVYTASTGHVTILGDITFQLNTDPATNPPVFTLTCTSTGGPATTVSWRRNGEVLTESSSYSITSQILLDTETATYNQTLMVTGRLEGQYQCSMSNIRTPSGSTRSLEIAAAGSPTNLNAVQIGPSSFSVYWTPRATVTGYQVYWSGGGGVDSGNMSAGAEDRTVTITGRTPGLTYAITIVALSDHLPSSAVAVMVTLGNVRFSLRGTTYQNNSLVTLEDIGEGDDALHCLTDLTACCRPHHTGYCGVGVFGNWYFPNGTRVPSSGNEWDFHRTSGWMVKVLHRRRGGVDGIYHCVIPDKAGVNQNIYIGVYSANTGQVTIPGGITFQLDTDPATDPPVFTLTCTSTGGPASTVSWRRDGTMLSDNSNNYITSQVMNSVTATYTNTLTVTGRLVGEYECSVFNSRTPSGSTRSLTVVAAGLPTNLNVVQVNLTSFSVSWTPPATMTGYQVYWSGGGVDSGNMSAGAGDVAVTITGRTPGLTYNITIVALSDHLPSPTVGAVMVTLVSTPTLLPVTLCPQVMESGSPVGAVVGACIGTALLYTVILLVSICAIFLWNKKRHRKTAAGKESTHRTPLDTDVMMKECSAYGRVAAHSGQTEDVYENPQ